MRALARATLPVVLTPGVVHLPTVPAHRKVNRVDMGPADKVCAAALAIHERAERRSCGQRDVSFILLELGGAFSAALAIDGGRIVDGLGGSSGPMGVAGSGALDGEVAFLAGAVTKRLVFTGGAATVAGMAPGTPFHAAADASDPRARHAWDAYIESAAKAVATLAVTAPRAREVVLSGRMGSVAAVRDAIARQLAAVNREWSIQELGGFARAASHAAQGAALVADGLAGGVHKPIVDALSIRDASGTVLDHLYVIDQATAKRRIGIREGENPKLVSW
jgi:predicted butyrate kinase (DUF1464 family)